MDLMSRSSRRTCLLSTLFLLGLLLWIFIPDGRHRLRLRNPDGSLESWEDARERERKYDLLRRSAQRSSVDMRETTEFWAPGVDVTNQIQEAMKGFGMGGGKPVQPRDVPFVPLDGGKQKSWVNLKSTEEILGNDWPDDGVREKAKKEAGFSTPRARRKGKGRTEVLESVEEESEADLEKETEADLETDSKEKPDAEHAAKPKPKRRKEEIADAIARGREKVDAEREAKRVVVDG